MVFKFKNNKKTNRTLIRLKCGYKIQRILNVGKANGPIGANNRT
ncbi:hypothetical protein HMPREF9996_01447 [Aggregatibacter actinomycetemcomitans Y4]|nr:hypothetical protein HMPREF9996_01447 [Aggregatibacter actinomycetemcomitans Y4]